MRWPARQWLRAIARPIPEQERIERRLVTDKSARRIELPFAYDPAACRAWSPSLELRPPSLQDGSDDLARLARAGGSGLRSGGYRPAHPAPDRRAAAPGGMVSLGAAGTPGALRPQPPA